MQTVDFLQTAEWIQAQFSQQNREVLFVMLRNLVHSGVAAGSDALKIVMTTSHELVSIRDRLLSHPLAPTVMREFNLVELLKEDFPLRLALFASASSKTDPDPEWLDLSTALWRNWVIFTGCIAPLQRLVVPPQVLKETDFDEVLTLKLEVPDEYLPTIDHFRAVLRNMTELYAAIATLQGVREFPPLRILYVNSGSLIRIDLKGLGEPIKRVKELLIEGWNLIRYRKVEDLRQNNMALLQSLATMQEINSMRELGELPNEDAMRLSQQVLASAVALLEAGVVPREVKATEVVENQKLLSEFQRKLLPPAPSEAQRPPKTKRSSKHGSKKSKSSKNSDENPTTSR